MTTGMMYSRGARASSSWRADSRWEDENPPPQDLNSKKLRQPASSANQHESVDEQTKGSTRLQRAPRL